MSSKSDLDDQHQSRWLYNVARGIDKDPVQVKLVSKSIGCCKRFPGRTSLCKANAVEHWMKELSSEISDRLYEDLKENNRKAKLMTVSFSQETNQTEISSTRAVPLKSYEMDKICQQAIEVLEKYCRKPDGSYHITFLGLSIGNFENIKNVKTITSFFKRVDKTEPNTKKIDIFDDCSHNNDPTYTNSNQKDSARSTIIPEKESEMLMEVPLHDSDISICDEKSIFSDTTVELEEEPDDLFFYDDHTGSDRIYTEKLQARKTAGNKNLNFIALETNVLPNLKNSPNSPISYSPVLQSIKHENIDDESDSSREIKRNFDTSKIFRESYSSSDEENENITLEGSQSCTAELSENCKECGKHISVVDMVSHMDYHLALKLSKEIIPANEKLLQTKQKNNPPPKKRKICQTLGNIKSFCIQKNMNPDEITELCTECNKRIKIEDVSTHHDYHAAKKLHVELNSPSSKSERFNSNNPIASSSKVSSNNKNKKKIGKGKNISSFFKQLDS